MKLIRSISAASAFFAVVALAALPIAAHSKVTKPVLAVNTCSPSLGNVLMPGTATAYSAGYDPVGYAQPVDATPPKVVVNQAYSHQNGAVVTTGSTHYQAPLRSDPTVTIGYTNLAPKAIRSIDFALIAKGQIVADVRDVGDFAPGAKIKHSFALNPKIFPLGTGLAVCAPISITYADGTTWQGRR
ncbi:MAG: hypothetical protein ACP5O6_12230 [Candidatus Baltobacteraceae bacterium]